MVYCSCRRKFSVKIHALLDNFDLKKVSYKMSNEGLLDVGEHVKEKLPKLVTDVKLEGDELSLIVQKTGLIEVIQNLRDDRECMFDMMLDITAVDYPNRTERFELVYQFLSMRQNQRIRVKCVLKDGETTPSLLSLFPNAGWYEREVYDMYGIIFDGNPDLRRILTDYGFDGHPLRKDFPMTGYHEVIYDPELERVVYEPVKLTQDYRNFDYESPWEGMTDVQLAGDEKAVKPTHGSVSFKDDATN
jgi:NADH-quinone oxidoreductase subunit C